MIDNKIKSLPIMLPNIVFSIQLGRRRMTYEPMTKVCWHEGEGSRTAAPNADFSEWPL